MSGQKKTVKEKIIEVINYIARKDQKYFLYSTSMPLLDELKLQLSLGQFISKRAVYDEYIQTNIKVDYKLRRQIKLKATNEFEEFLSKILPMQIPKAYLENYHFLKNHSQILLLQQEFQSKPLPLLQESHQLV